MLKDFLPLVQILSRNVNLIQCAEYSGVLKKRKLTNDMTLLKKGVTFGDVIIVRGSKYDTTKAPGSSSVVFISFFAHYKRWVDRYSSVWEYVTISGEMWFSGGIGNKGSVGARDAHKVPAVIVYKRVTKLVQSETVDDGRASTIPGVISSIGYTGINNSPWWV